MTAASGTSGLSAVLFDLDGTLLDTRPGVEAAVEAALAEVTGTSARQAGIDWSLPLPALVDRLAAAEPADTRLAITEAFRRHYDGGLWARAEPMPGAEQCLAGLAAAGLRLFVVTNKRGRAASLLVERFGLAPYLEAVVGQADPGPAVPKSTLAERCLTDAGLEAADAIVVGDSDHDAEMAAALGMPFVAVTSGSGPLTRHPSGPDHIEVRCLADAASVLLHDSSPGRSLT